MYAFLRWYRLVDRLPMQPGPGIRRSLIAGLECELHIHRNDIQTEGELDVLEVKWTQRRNSVAAGFQIFANQ